MNNWEELHIGNEINILSGYPFDSKKFNTDKEGKPLIRIRDILESSINTYFSGSYSDAFLIKKGDILVGMDGDFHVAKWNNIDALLNQRILKVHQKRDAKIDIDFFYYFLQPFLKKVHDITAATTVKHLSTFDIIKAKNPFPEVKHQQKIAKILNTIDAVIEKTENAITKYQAIKKGMMYDLFTRGIDVKTGQLRPSFEVAPELYKESALGIIPKDWEIERLDQVATVVSGGTPSTENSEFWNGNILWASPTDITKTSGRVIYKTEKTISESGLKNSSARILPKGTLLMTSRATLGEIKVSNSEITTNQGFKSLVINDGQDNWFYFYYMSLQKLRYASFGIGTTFLEVNKKDTDSFLVIKPNPTEQQEISKRLFNCDNLIEKEGNILAKHQKIKKGLMQDLLTGKVEVNV